MDNNPKSHKPTSSAIETLPPGMQAIKAGDYIKMLSRQLEAVRRSNGQLLQQSGALRDELNGIQIEREQLMAENADLRVKLEAFQPRQTAPENRPSAENASKPELPVDPPTH